MLTLRENPEPGALVQELLLVDRFSIDLTRIAHDCFGPSGMTNRDVRVLLTIHRHPGIAPSNPADQLGVARAVVSHSLTRFRTARLVRDAINPVDHREHKISATATGRERIESFESHAAQWFAEREPHLRSILRLSNPLPEDAPDKPLAPLDVVSAVAAAEAPFTSEMSSVLLPYRVPNATDRYSLTLIDALAPIRPVELARTLHLTTGGVSALLDRLQDTGTIVRRHLPTETDRKSVHVSLSARGEEAALLRLEVFSRHRNGIIKALALALGVRVQPAE